MQWRKRGEQMFTTIDFYRQVVCGNDNSSCSQNTLQLRRLLCIYISVYFALNNFFVKSNDILNVACSHIHRRLEVIFIEIRYARCLPFSQNTHRVNEMKWND